jgi:hypothetical protein
LSSSPWLGYGYDRLLLAIYLAILRNRTNALECDTAPACPPACVPASGFYCFRTPLLSPFPSNLHSFTPAIFERHLDTQKRRQDVRSECVESCYELAPALFDLSFLFFLFEFSHRAQKARPLPPHVRLHVVKPTPAP